jgi:hypothetical protein
MTVKYIKIGESGYDIEFVVKDADGDVVDISSSDVTITVKDQGGTAIIDEEDCTGENSSGECTYAVQSGDFDTAGVYDVTLTVTTGSQILKVTGIFLNVESNKATVISTATIAEEVRNQVEDIPTTVDSGTNLRDMVDRGRKMVQNYTGDAVTSSNVSDTHHAVLFNLGCAYTLGKMIGTGVDFDVKLAEFDVKKGTRETPQSRQMKMHLDLVNQDLRNIGHKIGSIYAKVNG